jgi:hypothetical protein
MPFSHSNEKRDDMEEHATEPDGELDDEDEGAQEKSATKNQVHPHDVWREFLKTSAGRDKALVLHFYHCNRYPNRLNSALIVSRN